MAFVATGKVLTYFNFALTASEEFSSGQKPDSETDEETLHLHSPTNVPRAFGTNGIRTVGMLALLSCPMELQRRSGLRPGGRSWDEPRTSMTNPNVPLDQHWSRP